MKILLVEDDPFHAQVIGQALKSEFGSNTHIHIVRTEKQFRHEYIQDWNLALLDVMMPWTTEDDPEPYAGAPEEGYLRAGARCYEMLRVSEATKDVPVVFLTNLDKETVPEEAQNAYVRKSINFTPLIQKILEVRGKRDGQSLKK